MIKWGKVSKFKWITAHCLPACLQLCMSKSFLRRNIRTFNFTQRLFVTWHCVRILTQGHLGFKVIGRKVYNSCLVHIFRMEEKWNLLLNTKNFYDLMMCQIWLKVTCASHWKKKCIRLPNINSMFNVTSKYQTYKGEWYN